jgi:hypothetical protein
MNCRLRCRDNVRAGVVYDGTLRGALKEYQRSRAPGGKCFTIGIGPLAIEKYEGGMLTPAVIRELIKREAILSSQT